MPAPHPHIKPPVPGNRSLVEWPTLAMLIGCYLGWVIVMIWGVDVSPILSVLVMSVLLALHSSLQHEVLHGHPFRSQGWSEATVFVPLGLFIPYQRFRDLHLQHHYDPNLTDPYDDPESNYMDPGAWAATPVWLQGVYRFNNVLLGRMAVGPALSVWRMYQDDLKAAMAGDRRVQRAYLLHVIGLIPVVWTVSVSPLSWAAYLVASYLALSLLKIRTFLEHRAHEKVPGRTVIVESRGPLSILFLNNNFHSVHHAHPSLAWYRLPGYFAERRAQFLERNQSYLYRSYWDVCRQYLIRPKDPVPHPLRENVGVQEELELR